MRLKQRRWFVLAGLAVIAASPSWSRSATRPHVAAIPKYVGTISAENAPQFLLDVANRVDQIVGVQVEIIPSGNGGPLKYFVDRDDRLFVISGSVKNNFAQEGIEIVSPKDEASFLHGSWVLDGFYVVKSGGVHQGVASFGLQKVNEGEVLLSPKFAVKIRRIGPAPEAFR
jgi:hypothetical protein